MMASRLTRLKRIAIEINCALKEYKQVMKAIHSPEYEEERRAAHIIRLTHSIEKGLCIEKPKLGFGYEKINKVYTLSLEHIRKCKGDLICVYMATDAIAEYCAYHIMNGYDSEKFREIQKISHEMNLYKPAGSGERKYGGTQKLTKKDICFDVQELEAFFKSRHSVRDYENGKVSIDLIKKAVNIAQTAPSACNRQAVRVYAIDSRKYVSDLNTNLEGVGGFTDSVDRFLIITGKTSAYDEFEYKQFVVSAGIFAGCLCLALHAMQLGACMIQRSIRTGGQWIEFCKKNDIPTDEQIVCLIAVGKLKPETIVPISMRYPIDKVFRELC